MDISVIIVNYNTMQLTLNALQSVYESVTKHTLEVILVDNASSDGSVKEIRERFPEVQVIENKVNVGYAKANNQAINESIGRYVLLLNSDTLVENTTIDTIVRFMDQNGEVGAAGCKIVLPDGSLDKACRRGFPTPSASFYYAFGISKLFPDIPRFNKYQLGYLDPDKDYPVDCLVGAFMMIRKKAIEEVGLLDETFFMYGEDIDWCYRIKQAGWGIYYYPHVRILHLKGASSRKKPFKIIYEFHRAMYVFHRKHYQNKYSTFVNFVVYMGIAVKFVASLLMNRFGSVR